MAPFFLSLLSFLSEPRHAPWNGFLLTSFHSPNLFPEFFHCVPAFCVRPTFLFSNIFFLFLDSTAGVGKKNTFHSDEV